MTDIPQLQGNIYFASDLHLGIPDHATSLVREKKFIQWLDAVHKDADAIFIVGDLFDFWFEYKEVVPRGFVRVLGKLAALRDQGIPVYFFTGNHDQWMKNYFQEELNITVYHEAQRLSIAGKKFLVAHGDGLGPGDHGYKFLKKIFRNRFCQWAFGILPPAIGMGLANYFSKKSREATGQAHTEKFLGEENEWLITYCKEVLQKEHYDYFIFGHRHLPIDHTINNSRYINLGEWINYCSYAVFDGNTTELKYYR